MNSLTCLFALVVLTAYVSASIPVVVTSVVALGNQSDAHLAPTYPNRDGGAVGSLGGKIVWFWSDTSYINNGKLVGFLGNTAAIGNPNNPLLVDGPERQAIPFTADENDFNNKYSFNPRVVLWPKSGVVEISPGHGIIYVPKGYWGKTITEGEPNSGVELCNVTIGSDGQPSVTRLSTVPIFPSGTPSYGGVAALNYGGYVYLYSEDRIATYSAPTYLARVPVGQVYNKASYQYYYAQSKTWESKAPALNDTKEAVLVSTFGIDGNVYWSTYHSMFIMIFQYDADNKVQIMSAPEPQGPWTGAKVIYTPPPPTAITYIYGTTGTNLYDPSGKTASICFTWNYVGGYANWVAKATFQ